MTARLKGRHREVDRVLRAITAWARSRDDVDAVALVGSYARGTTGMASDVDLVVLTHAFAQLAAEPEWFRPLRPGSRLIRSAVWGPLLERRYPTPSGLHVEVGLASPAWAELPLDAGTRWVLGDGHRILYDDNGLLTRAGNSLTPATGPTTAPELVDGGTSTASPSLSKGLQR